MDFKYFLHIHLTWSIPRRYFWSYQFDQTNHIDHIVSGQLGVNWGI